MASHCDFLYYQSGNGKIPQSLRSFGMTGENKGAFTTQ